MKQIDPDTDRNSSEIPNVKFWACKMLQLKRELTLRQSTKNTKPKRTSTNDYSTFFDCNRTENSEEMVNKEQRKIQVSKVKYFTSFPQRFSELLNVLKQF